MRNVVDSSFQAEARCTRSSLMVGGGVMGLVCATVFGQRGTRIPRATSLVQMRRALVASHGCNPLKAAGRIASLALMSRVGQIKDQDFRPSCRTLVICCNPLIFHLRKAKRSSCQSVAFLPLTKTAIALRHARHIGHRVTQAQVEIRRRPRFSRARSFHVTYRPGRNAPSLPVDITARDPFRQENFQSAASPVLANLHLFQPWSSCLAAVPTTNVI